ncbi:hypothetical protein CKAH01_14938 [Colletotrichum kahawae]|uniref:Zn(2)-C6 fungal-type domain-containing protein n=1 Tax=Colletotrichum kahawae TaxID=34407 RepID=A0AAD9YN19_COLKA|nr:hypothetical protein CKAH01_14938 [Colletotrichum kahawae]
MARKGNRKVRTGCITCKARKVKCDEGKPSCVRCIKTGRVCDGYLLKIDVRDPVGSRDATTLTLHRPHHVFPGANSSSEGHALQFFCETAGPLMSGTADPYFWTNIVLQFSAFEPAVRHAVISISDLFQQSYYTPESNAKLRFDDQTIALKHYNNAIHGLKDIKSEHKESVVLLVCVLFVCIEFIRGDREAALRHCSHGVEILKTSPQHAWTKQHLLPIFRRLNEFAFFFSDENSDFSDISDLAGPIPTMFSTFSEAQEMLDGIFNHTTRIMRSSRKSHLLPKTASGMFEPQKRIPVFSQYFTDKATISRLLNTWLKLFSEFDPKMTELDALAAKHCKHGADYGLKMYRCFLLTRYECCRIWLNIAFDDPKSGYERSVDNFDRVLKQQSWLESQIPHEGPFSDPVSPPFVFETGFGANLFFLVTTCCNLEMRLELIRLMSIFALPRENLWEKDVLIAAARKIIEVEHGTKFEDLEQSPTAPSYSEETPTEEDEEEDAEADEEETDFGTPEIWAEQGESRNGAGASEEEGAHKSGKVLRRDNLALFGSYLLILNPFMTGKIGS